MTGGELPTKFGSSPPVISDSEVKLELLFCNMEELNLRNERSLQ